MFSKRKENNKISKELKIKKKIKIVYWNITKNSKLLYNFLNLFIYLKIFVIENFLNPKIEKFWVVVFEHFDNFGMFEFLYFKISQNLWMQIFNRQ